MHLTSHSATGLEVGHIRALGLLPNKWGREEGVIGCLPHLLCDPGVSDSALIALLNIRTHLSQHRCTPWTSQVPATLVLPHSRVWTPELLGLLGAEGSGHCFVLWAVSKIGWRSAVIQSWERSYRLWAAATGCGERYPGISSWLCPTNVAEESAHQSCFQRPVALHLPTSIITWAKPL